ncbi:MAG: ABC transporter ATP-binding protein [Planctomycetota bacterium]|nr:ABC transporter ATP-binding protein [Planctomycetota bacterium]MDA1138165.1 ABC transporter ATP-binding protein [Planctomycetota bacterium]
MLLELKNLSKAYHRSEGPLPILTEANLSLAANEFASIQGPSGCGKSTILLISGGLLKPDEGDVLIDGKDPYKLGSSESTSLRAAKVGFVFQQFYLIPYLTVIDNIMAPILAVGQNRALATERARKAMARFKLTERSNHLPSELSAGECQRTALARALLNQPSLLLADEPTGNLDPDNAGIVLDAMTEFADSGGAVLLVTHDESAAERAGRRFRIENGHLSESGG